MSRACRTHCLSGNDHGLLHLFTVIGIDESAIDQPIQGRERRLIGLLECSHALERRLRLRHGPTQGPAGAQSQDQDEEQWIESGHRPFLVG